MQIATAPCVRTQYAMASTYWTECGREFSFWMYGVRAFSFWTQPYQGIFLLDTAVSGQMASGQHVSWHCGYAGGQDREPRSKYLCRIHKHTASSRHSDSVQFYYLSISNVHLYMLLPHFVFPAQVPSVTSVAAIITCSNAVLVHVALL